MKFFYDTEFLERGPEHPIELISIAVVAEDGREIELANAEFDPARATPWLRENVLPHLPPQGSAAWKTRREIAAALRAFVGLEIPEWWAYYADYDHVVLCQIFGDMMALPDGWPMFTRDLAQLREALGNPALPPPVGSEHRALDDARWARALWLSLTGARGNS